MRRRPDLGEEGGIALTVAILSLALMITLGGVVLQQAIAALRQSGHQTDVKRALQAADAAVDAAAYRVARLDLGGALVVDPLNPGSVTSQNCVITTGGAVGMDSTPLDTAQPADPDGNRWCPESAPETTSDNATFTYRTSQLLRLGSGGCGAGSTLSLDRDVVGIGTSRGVTRRVKARLRANFALLSGAAVQSSSAGADFTMAGTAAVLGDVHTNASIAGSVTNAIVGKAVRGPGKSISGVVPVGASGAACQLFSLPDVDQGVVVATNDNAMRSDGCVASATMLPIACTLPIVGTTGGVAYNAARRTLDIWGNGRAVLSGANYSFCSVTVRGQGILEIANTAPVTRIFLDDPGNCRDAGTNAVLPDAGQLKVHESGRIANCHAMTAPESLQIYAVGNTGLPTTQTLAASALVTGSLRTALCGLNPGAVTGEPLTLVAPHSTVELGGSTAIAGQVAADTVHMSGAAQVRPVNALVNLNQLGANPVLPLYRPTGYTECTGRSFSRLPATNPSQGC